MHRARAGLQAALLAADRGEPERATSSATAAQAALRRATHETRAVWMARADELSARFQRQSLVEQVAASGLDIRRANGAIVVSLPALFAPGRAELRQERRALLDEIGRLAKWHRRLPVVVAAHTDSVGPTNDNLVLSSRRAEAVVDYLVGERGVRPDQVEAAGYGESQPIADNADAPGRARNRRVDISFLLR
jgi:outer membrane protein OmpA-like peptidoglycan-associated protein